MKERIIVHSILIILLSSFFIAGYFYKENKNLTEELNSVLNKLQETENNCTLIEASTTKIEIDNPKIIIKETKPIQTFTRDRVERTMELGAIGTFKDNLIKEEELIRENSISEDLYFGMTQEELDILYAVVQQEGGPYYDSAVAVMSTIVNRINNPDKWSWAGDTIFEQITYPQQYCYSLDDYWVQYVGNADEEVIQAVNDVLQYGPVYDYDCFRGYYLEDCEQIYDNWYFIG